VGIAEQNMVGVSAGWRTEVSFPLFAEPVPS
jgi:transketolase C-terminal domain/subunit